MYQWLSIPLAYLIGSLTGGSIVGRLLGVDVGSRGSGNVGTTNALRVMGFPAALAVLIIDLGKGILAVFLARLLGDSSLVMLAAALAVVAGHNWPLYFRFKGGKGVATTFGVLLAIDPWMIIILAAVMIILVVLTRYVSLGSVVGALLLPFLFWYRSFPVEFIVFAVLLSALAIYRHWGNIGRLWRGEEHKFGEKAKN